MQVLKFAKATARGALPESVFLRIWRLINKVQSLRTYRFTFPASDRKIQGDTSPFIISRDNVLEELGKKYLPTKRTNNYLVYYWMHLRDIRLQVRNVLEIGVQRGHSIRMWEEFFPRAAIYGLDIDPKCKQVEGGRRKILIGDQSDPAFLSSVVKQVGCFDVIIDDGSHKVAHQLKSFEVLFPSLSDHGIYALEDVGGGVGDFNLRTVNALKTLVDKIMYWPSDLHPREWRHLSRFAEGVGWLEQNIIGISFYRWIVFIMRGNNPGDNPFLGTQVKKGS